MHNKIVSNNCIDKTNNYTNYFIKDNVIQQKKTMLNVQ